MLRTPPACSNPCCVCAPCVCQNCTCRTDAARFRRSFVFTWTIGVLCIVAPIVAGVVVPFLAHGLHAVLWGGVGVLCGLVAVLMHTADSQIRYKTGQLFLRGFANADGEDSIVARDVSQIVAFCRVQTARGRMPVVCGYAWSNWLGYKAYTCPVIHTHRLAGVARCDDARGVEWLPGTKIKAVQEHHVTREGKLLHNSPSTGNISIGAWFASKSHGNNGSSIKAFLPQATLRVLDMASLAQFTIASDDYSRRSQQEQRRWCILGIVFGPQSFAENARLKRQARVVRDVGGIRAFVHTPSVQRYIFVGRRQVLSVLWTRPDDDGRASSRRSLSKWLRFLVLTAVGWGSVDYTEADDYTRSFYEAAYELPDTVVPIQTWVGTLCRVVNFEVFVAFRGAEQLWELVRALRDIVETHGGRCELRLIDETTCLDFVAYLSTVSDVVQSIARTGVAIKGVHKGKFDVSHLLWTGTQKSMSY